ncbi:MAG: hypothetical protein IJP62_04430 [Treponema sp.]|nr:hypothetical protein [Treponema sp.]
MADIAQMTSIEKAAARDAKAAARQAAFDRLPVFIQLLIGLAILVGIAVVGFVILWVIDFAFLDLDPLGRLFGLIK